MNGTINIMETVTSPIQYLPVGDSFELQFAPLAGAITADVGWVRNVDAPPVEEEPGVDFEPTENVRFRVRLFRPGSNRPAAQKTVAGNALRDLPNLNYQVPADQAGGTWHCGFTNDGEWDVRFRPRVTFVKQILELKQTAIPVRVLNHGLSQLLKALDLRIHLDKDRSYVDFSDGLKRLTGDRITRVNFSVPHLEDVNLRTLDADVIVPLHTSGGEARWGQPLVRVYVQFETRGTEIDNAFVDVDLEGATVTVRLSLDGHFDSLGRPTGRIRITPTAQVGLRGTTGETFLSGLLSVLIPGLSLADRLANIRRVREAMQQAVDRFLATAENQVAIGEYLAKGLAQLAVFGDQFYDVAGAANAILVSHYNPAPQPPPNFSLIEAPLTLEDQLAVNRINAVGLANLDKIDHIVVLMQENRSFDHMLGYLRKDKGRTDVEGLTGTESNAAPGRNPRTVYQLPDTVFLDDPAHEHDQVLLQIADGAMSGFMASFIGRHPDKDYRQIMGYYGESQLPTYTFLAEQFLVCDHWFCSHPGPTQPNRLSLLIGGRIPELENFMADSPALGFLMLPTIFDLLTERRVDWVYYEQDVTFLRTFDRYRLDDTHIIPFDDRREGFWTRASQGTLPQVTFIEPAFLDVAPAKRGNDDHPPTDITRGQEMIGCIYNALAASPQWGRMLFVITYDEHGGFFDHVAPPGTRKSPIRMTVPPMHPNGPSFYGPRVPALVVSPWVPAGSVDKSVFDHTSIAKTIVLKFLRRQGPTVGEAFPTLGSRRLARAAHLGRLLTLDTPRLNVPPVPGLTCPPPPQPVRRPPPGLAAPPPDDFHEAMRRFGRPKMHTP
jgi:phospholipase C